MGLAIDVGVLYAVKARLSAACDAASLAAARGLNVGQTIASQQAKAQAQGTAFYAGNFPDTFLGAVRNPPVIDVPIANPGNTMTVTTTGSAFANTYFMRYFGLNGVTVTASGKASRRDVNVMLVLDRSYSMVMSSSCEPMKTAAQNFVDRFVEGRDKVGLITFGSTKYIAFPPANNFKSAGPPNVRTLIGQIACGGTTSIAAAYWTAYQQLVTTLNQPGALNVIVLFTDGQPNGVTAQYPKKATSTCSIAGPITGVISHYTSPVQSTGTTIGVLQTDAISMSNANEVVASGATGCAFNAPGSNTPFDPYNPNSQNQVRQDIAYMPDQDIYGNNTNGANQYSPIVNSDFAPGYPSHIRIDSPLSIVKGSTNAMDHAAKRTRLRELNPGIDIVTFTIGLGDPAAADPPDDMLLNRVANDPRSNIYVHDTVRPDGMYIRATNTAEMAVAFDRIAAEVLRLSR
jgi:Flp pilus assembly protein TadG